MDPGGDLTPPPPEGPAVLTQVRPSASAAPRRLLSPHSGPLWGGLVGEEVANGAPRWSREQPIRARRRLIGGGARGLAGRVRRDGAGEASGGGGR